MLLFPLVFPLVDFLGAEDICGFLGGDMLAFFSLSIPFSVNSGGIILTRPYPNSSSSGAEVMVVGVDEVGRTGRGLAKLLGGVCIPGNGGLSMMG